MIAFLQRRWHSLVFRLLFYFLLGLLALAVVIAISFSQRIKPHVQQQVLPNVARYLDYIIDDIGVPPDLAVAARLADELPFELRIVGNDLDWSSNERIRPLSEYRFRPAPAPYQQYSISYHRRQDVLLVPRGDYRYLFQVEDGFRRGSERRHWLLFLSLGSILLLLYFGIRRLFRPIAGISAQVDKIGSGDLEQQISLEGGGELGQLAAGINRMAGQIRSMLEGKSAMLLAISHELRSPLTRMRVNLELLEASELRDRLVEDCREMEALLSAILESEKLSSGHAPLMLERRDLAALISEVVEHHADRQRLRTELATLNAEVDPLRFRLLVKNLVDNACEYSREQGGPVDIRLRAEATGFMLEVVDTGIGIPADELPRLNEAFYRPDSSRQRNTGGYGLGLYLCQLIVRAHGGEMTIESELGQGTRVRVRIPADNS